MALHFLKIEFFSHQHHGKKWRHTGLSCAIVGHALVQSVPTEKPKYTVLYFANVKKWQAVKILSAEKTLLNKSLKYHKEIYVAQIFNFRTKLFLKKLLWML